MELTLRPSRISSTLSFALAITYLMSFRELHIGEKIGAVPAVMSSILVGFWFLHGSCSLFASVRLESTGFTTKTIFKQRHYYWDEVKVFTVSRYGLSSGMVVCNFSAQENRPRRGWFWKTVVSDHDAMISPFLADLRCEGGLVETLNQWRLRSRLESSVPRTAIAS